MHQYLRSGKDGYESRPRESSSGVRPGQNTGEHHGGARDAISVLREFAGKSQSRSSTGRVADRKWHFERIKFTGSPSPQSSIKPMSKLETDVLTPPPEKSRAEPGG